MKIKVTDNKELEKEVRAALAKNDGYCPCKLARIPENKCVCEEFRQSGLGECHCGLYIKTEL